MGTRQIINQIKEFNEQIKNLHEAASKEKNVSEKIKLIQKANKIKQEKDVFSKANLKH